MCIVHGGHEAWLLDVVLAYQFKAAFGARGLFRHLWAMEKSELAAYGELARRGEISRLSHHLLVM